MPEIRIAISDSGKIQIAAPDGTFDEASGAIKALLDDLKAEGIQIEQTSAIEAHSHHQKHERVRTTQGR